MGSKTVLTNLMLKLFTWLIKKVSDPVDPIVRGYPVEKFLCCQLNRVPLDEIASPCAKTMFSKQSVKKTLSSEPEGSLGAGVSLSCLGITNCLLPGTVF